MRKRKTRLNCGFIGLVITLLFYPFVEAKAGDSIQFKGIDPVLSIRYDLRKILPTTTFLEFHNKAKTAIDKYESIELRYTMHTTGSKRWHHIYHYPYYGFAVSKIRIPDTDELGSPWAMYGYIGGPIAKTFLGDFRYEFGLGFSINWDGYDAIENRYNVAIGSEINARIHGGISYVLSLTNRVSLTTEFGFVHFSNGSVREPNRGLNVYGVSAQIGYHFDKLGKGEIPRGSVSECKSRNEWYVFGAIGSKQKDWDYLVYNEKYLDINFLSSSLTVGWLRKISTVFKAGIASNTFYDSSRDAVLTKNENQEWEKREAKLADKLCGGLAGNVQLEMGPVLVNTGFGHYLWQTDLEIMRSVKWYQTVRLSFVIRNQFLAGIQLRSHNFSVADGVEFGFGYRWSK